MRGSPPAYWGVRVRRQIRPGVEGAAPPRVARRPRTGYGGARYGWFHGDFRCAEAVQSAMGTAQGSGDATDRASPRERVERARHVRQGGAREAARGPVSLLVLDLKLPDMDGPVLAHQVPSRRSDAGDAPADSRTRTSARRPAARGDGGELHRQALRGARVPCTHPLPAATHPAWSGAAERGVGAEVVRCG